MADSDDGVLMKVAVFGIAVSIFSTALIGIILVDGGDYSYDQINGYRDDLITFSGQTMLNQTPWVLTNVYTPWVSGYGVEGHILDGWLFGESVEYPEIGKSADISLDPGQKSTVPLQYTSGVVDYTVRDGNQWWASGWLSWVGGIAEFLGIDPGEYRQELANTWNFSGYRYVFDPTLPFSTTDASGTVSTRDGSLSLVWYTYNGQEGLSGGLEIYGGRTVLASYSATDIITAYQSSSGYATVYDFDFEGTHLNLSVRFDAKVIEDGMPLMQAWTQGYWSMAISSVSAGNFFDITESTSFSTTAGSMIDTFIQIYTFDYPKVQNPWANLVLWLMVGLPMTIAMLCVTLKLINGFRVL